MRYTALGCRGGVSHEVVAHEVATLLAFGFWLFFSYISLFAKEKARVFTIFSSCRLAAKRDDFFFWPPLYR